jgi:hypothetical protein
VVVHIRCPVARPIAHRRNHSLSKRHARRRGPPCPSTALWGHPRRIGVDLKRLRSWSTSRWRRGCWPDG